MGFMVIWPILLLGLAVACIAAIVWAVQGSSRGRSSTPAPDGADEAPGDILRRRYASGEITREQFEEMQRTLGTT